MHSCKMLMLFLFAFSGLQVHAQLTPLEITGSGDGINDSSTYSRLPLIDDNGEISTAVPAIDVIQSMGELVDNFTDSTLLSTDSTTEETFVDLFTNANFTDVTNATVAQVSQTTDFTTEMPTTSTLVDSTTTTPLKKSTVPETTTLELVPTEEDTTTSKTTTSYTTSKTTKKPIKTDSATEAMEGIYSTKLMDAPAEIPPTPVSASTLPMSQAAGKRCLFKDTRLMCQADLICYGEGEIDCTDDDDDDEEDSEEMDSMEAILPPIDDSDYVAEQKSSEMFPIRKIDSNSMKMDLFKVFPLTPINDASSEKNKGISTTSMTTITSRISTAPMSHINKGRSTTSMPHVNLSMAENEEFVGGEKAESNFTTNAGDVVNVLDSEVFEELVPFSSTTKTMPFLGNATSSTDNSSNTFVSEDSDSMLLGKGEFSISIPEVLQIETPATVKHFGNGTFVEDNNDTSSAYSTAFTVDTKTAFTSDNILSENSTEGAKKDPEITRTKREKNANNSNGYYISSYKVSELESSKKKLKVKACKLSGNLVCFPHPTTTSCSGKTRCQVPPPAIETVEQPATQKGLEKWTIAVIVICAITATFTISLLIYLIFTSYKKLKVQPQNGVTTLNYVNSAQP